MAGTPPSLKGRALRLLSLREHSRAELQRKLARHSEDMRDVDAILDELERQGWLNNERFAESLVHRKAARMGVTRLRQELAQHGLDGEVSSRALAGLRESETERAREVWLKRFGQPPADAAERARQTRFLLARGFSSETIRHVLRHAVDTPEA